MSSGFFPGMTRIASSSAERYFLQAHLKLRPAQPRVTSLPYSHVILLHFVQYFPLYTLVYIPQLYIIKR